MRLVRYGEPGYEEPGVLLDDGRAIDASSEFRDFDEGFFACAGLESLQRWIDDGCTGGTEIPKGARIGAPVARPSKIVCVGKNYLEHAKEFGGEVPSEPVLFMKATSAYVSGADDVHVPRNSEKLDYEVELAIVIGKTASYVLEEDARSYIAGYSVMCDYSERAFQKERSGQWVKGKSADTFAPMGPCLLTADELPDPQALRLWSKVNGDLRQSGWTGDMLFSVDYIVSYISQFMTLLPGDVIATGTPAGVGMGFDPPRFLQVGDLVEFGVEGIGSNIQRVTCHK
jgi:2,4-diketo-3-deoxy-L-fuconate hydrolase